ncbi:hypothetical protein DUNSADRAFT_3281 [Dunaliella salina]|uniref:Uncharacterized protein n=1 Tax=Dunaliella salina TaxID=3046 RepID=A0ABQ7GU63_DUNSA|nr:hypothetical protein DUNSADRAFT_3281 [Dunaliella salina]|eukprot:KAF5838156.1 hypothetical protein DUNSADRAFT_3281 [Dunaliella salina]
MPPLPLNSRPQFRVPAPAGSQRCASRLPPQRRSFDSNSKAGPCTATEISTSQCADWQTTPATASTSQPNNNEPLCFSQTSVPSSSEAAGEQQESCVDESLSVASLSCAAESSLYSSEASQKDHNSVTIKSDTSVKDAAGAICKVLNRLASTFVTALQLDNSHEAANRAVKALAVSRKYIQDAATGHELGFYPLNRTNLYGEEDPNLFAFLAFKTLLAPGIELKDHDKTDLNVSTSGDPNKIANAIICIGLILSRVHIYEDKAFCARMPLVLCLP